MEYITLKSFIEYVVLALSLILILNVATANAMWAKLTDTELVEQSDVIITAELTGHTQATINQVEFDVGVLKVEEVLKGDKNQAVIHLALPSTEGPRKSDDIFYKEGQKGLWFLREREAEGESGIYLADHPQRFLSIEHAGDHIKAIRKILNNN